jgi:hypothetical protein
MVLGHGKRATEIWTWRVGQFQRIFLWARRSRSCCGCDAAVPTWYLPKAKNESTSAGQWLSVKSMGVQGGEFASDCTVPLNWLALKLCYPKTNGSNICAQSCVIWNSKPMVNSWSSPGPLQHTNPFWLAKCPGSLFDRDIRKSPKCVWRGSRFCKRL